MASILLGGGQGGWCGFAFYLDQAGWFISTTSIGFSLKTVLAVRHTVRWLHEKQ
jgi:hypothetical protein